MKGKSKVLTLILVITATLAIITLAPQLSRSSHIAGNGWLGISANTRLACNSVDRLSSGDQYLDGLVSLEVSPYGEIRVSGGAGVEGQAWLHVNVTYIPHSSTGDHLAPVTVFLLKEYLLVAIPATEPAEGRVASINLDATTSGSFFTPFASHSVGPLSVSFASHEDTATDTNKVTVQAYVTNAKSPTSTLLSASAFANSEVNLPSCTR